jgi:hypothetical protein
VGGRLGVVVGVGVVGLSVLPQRKFKSFRYTQSHGVLGMNTWLKTKLFITVCEKIKGKVLYFNQKV